MLGAIIGDIIGSRFEWNNCKSKDFELFTKESRFTDDSVMTIAVANAMVESRGDYDNLSDIVLLSLKDFGRRYPDVGYGERFYRWLMSDDNRPYNSYGNGAAMRVSAIGYFAQSISEVKELAYKVTAITHNHPEGIKGAEAVSLAIYLARLGYDKAYIKEYIMRDYYDIGFSLDDIRDDYSFDVTCQGSVPHAIVAFLESDDYEDCIRCAISIGGDSDTIAAIAGSIAEAYYGIPMSIKDIALTYMDEYLRQIIAKIR